MRYFIANLMAHLCVILVLIVLIIIFSKRNQKRKNKYAFSYLLPTIFAIITVAYIGLIVGPRLLDITDVIDGTYQSYTGTLEKKSFFNNFVEVDGIRFYHNPLHEIPEIGQPVRVLYTHNSDFTVSVECVELTDEELSPELNISDSASLGE
ncbi:MAG: hypothetical protein MJ172_02350 [Clostridia bacterium]|nr:hypothetical protein [Clostridia bacterium]